MPFIQQKTIIVMKCLASCAALMTLGLLGVVPEAWSRDLHVTTIDAPSGQSIELHAVSPAGQLTGEIKDHQGTHGLLCPLPCNLQGMRSIDLWFNGEKAVSTQIRSMPAQEQIAGSVIDRKGAGHGFVCGGVSSVLRCRQIDVMMNNTIMTDTLVLAMQKQGDVAGSYRDKSAKIYGFLLHNDRFETVEVPRAMATVVTAISPSSTEYGQTLAGFFVDAAFAVHGFLCELPIRPQCFRSFDVTLDGAPQTMTHPVGFTRTQIVGSFRDQAGESHGFQCHLPVQPDCFIQLDVPNEKHTEIFGVNEQGQLVGQYYDSTNRPRAFASHLP